MYQKRLYFVLRDQKDISMCTNTSRKGKQKKNLHIDVKNVSSAHR